MAFIIKLEVFAVAFAEFEIIELVENGLHVLSLIRSFELILFIK